MDCSVVIRGPLYSCSLDSVSNYLKLNCPVIVSYWENGRSEISLDTVVWDSSSSRFVIDKYEPKLTEEMLQKLEGILYDNVKSVRNKYKEISSPIVFDKFRAADRNVYQFHSSLSGLDLCETEYVICLRSDMPYPNIEPFISKIKDNPNKIITSDTNFRKNDHFQYHIGSHVVGGKTKYVKQMYSKCVNLTQNNSNKFQQERNRILQVVTDPVGEQVMGCSVMLMNNENFTRENACILVKKHFDLVKVSEMGGVYRNFKTKMVVGDIISKIEEYC